MCSSNDPEEKLRWKKHLQTLRRLEDDLCSAIALRKRSNLIFPNTLEKDLLQILNFICIAVGGPSACMTRTTPGRSRQRRWWKYSPWCTPSRSVESLQGKSTDTCFKNLTILMFQNQWSDKMFYIECYLQGSSEEDAVEQARKVVSILADICWFW